jgi:thioesterase domain-containing protein
MCAAEPYRLLGHSIGAAVALEVARQLEAAGERVGQLVVADLPAPRADVAWPFADWDDARWVYGVGKVLEHAGRGSALDLGLDLDLLRATDDAGRRAALREAMEAAGVLPCGAPQVYVDGIVQTMKWAELQFAAYRPGAIDGPILVLRATQELTLDGGYDLQQGGADTETWGWEALGGEVRACRVPGDHLSMLEAPHVARLAHLLALALGPVEARAA